jgi:hypothetical protein
MYGSCTYFGSTGTVLASCTASGLSSVVTLAVQSQAVTGGTKARYFYAGCSAPSAADTKCSATAGWGASSCSTAAVQSCGGALTSTKSITLSCSCASVRWIVASVATRHLDCCPRERRVLAPTQLGRWLLIHLGPSCKKSLRTVLCVNCLHSWCSGRQGVERHSRQSFC